MVLRSEGELAGDTDAYWFFGDTHIANHDYHYGIGDWNVLPLGDITAIRYW